MVKRTQSMRIESSDGKVYVVRRRKNGNLGESEVSGGVSAAPHFAADDAVQLYDGKTLAVIKGNLFVFDKDAVPNS